MFRKHEMIPSESMGRHVHLWRYGHFGLPVLVFPSASHCRIIHATGGHDSFP